MAKFIFNIERFATNNENKKRGTYFLDIPFQIQIEAITFNDAKRQINNIIKEISKDKDYKKSNSLAQTYSFRAILGQFSRDTITVHKFGDY